MSFFNTDNRQAKEGQPLGKKITKDAGLFTKDFSASLAALATMHELSNQRKAMMGSVGHSFCPKIIRQSGLSINRQKLESVIRFPTQELDQRVEQIEAAAKTQAEDIQETYLAKSDFFASSRLSSEANPKVFDSKAKESSRVIERPMKAIGSPEVIQSHKQDIQRKLFQIQNVPAQPVQSIIQPSLVSSKKFRIGSSSSRNSRRRSVSKPAFNNQTTTSAMFFNRKSNPAILQPSQALAMKLEHLDENKLEFFSKQTEGYSLYFQDGIKIKSLRDYHQYPLTVFDSDYDSSFNYEYFVKTHRKAKSRWLFLDGRVEWKDCIVEEYHPDSKEFTISWVDMDDSSGQVYKSQKRVSRMNLLFEGEDINSLELKREQADKTRCMHLLSKALKNAALFQETIPPMRVIFKADLLHRIIQK